MKNDSKTHELLIFLRAFVAFSASGYDKPVAGPSHSEEPSRNMIAIERLTGSAEVAAIVRILGLIGRIRFQAETVADR